MVGAFKEKWGRRSKVKLLVNSISRRGTHSQRLYVAVPHKRPAIQSASEPSMPTKALSNPTSKCPKHTTAEISGRLTASDCMR